MAQVKDSSKENWSWRHFAYESVRIISWISSRVGLSGFISVSLIAFVFLYATEEQKEKIIDKYVLFEDGIGYPLFIIVLLSVVILVQRSSIKAMTKYPQTPVIKAKNPKRTRSKKRN